MVLSTKRAFGAAIRGVAIAGMLTAAAAVAAPTVAMAKVFSLHVGIDDYEHVGVLDGAVSDAQTFHDLFVSVGADAMVLADRDATLENIVTRFRDMARRAQPGDFIVFTYAGHGYHAPEKMPFDEVDGRDEFFVLPEFDPAAPRDADMLVDNYVYELFAEVPKDVAIVFIVDSCHSGTMTRSTDARGQLGKTRQVSRSADWGNFTGGSALGPSDASFQKDMSDLENVIFVAAARDDQLALETDVTGTPRGSLSVAVEEVFTQTNVGIGSVADLERLRAHVVDRVQGLTSGRQDPTVAYDEGFLNRLALVETGAPGVSASDAMSAVTRSIARVQPIAGGSASQTTNQATREASGELQTASIKQPLADAYRAKRAAVFVDGPGADSVRDAIGGFADIADRRAAADLIWDLAAGEIVDRRGADMIGVAGDAASAARVIDKWRAVQALADWTPTRSIPANVAPLNPALPQDYRFPAGERINLEVVWPFASADPLPYLTVVSLANGGEIYNVSAPTVDEQRKFSPAVRKVLDGPFEVAPPFGADHILVFASAAPMGDFQMGLDRLNGTTEIEQLLRLVDRFAAGPDVRVGVARLYTTDG